VAAGRERLEARVWHTNRVLWHVPFGEPYALGHLWDHASHRFLDYYVNLQDPLRRSADGFDSLDHVLDVVAADSTWRWKDEDEFADAVHLGLFSAAEAEAIRGAGERVIGRLAELLPTGWEDWRPDPAWPLPGLPPV
jgi:predicted RNA-binding protein associated with RNAse of E/G family